MIFFSPTIRALQAHITELQVRLAVADAARDLISERAQPVIAAHEARLVDLREQYDARVSELQAQIEYLRKENAGLLDRLLLKHNFTPVSEGASVTPRPSSPLHYIAPPGVNPIEIQDAIKDHWLQEEADYLVNTLGFDEYRARAQAEQAYKDQHGITH